MDEFRRVQILFIFGSVLVLGAIGMELGERFQPGYGVLGFFAAGLLTSVAWVIGCLISLGPREEE